MRHASCDMRHASCVTRHASCVMRHASCVMLGPPLSWGGPGPPLELGRSRVAKQPRAGPGGFAGEDQGGLLRSLASLSTRCLRSWGSQPALRRYLKEGAIVLSLIVACIK